MYHLISGTESSTTAYYSKETLFGNLDLGCWKYCIRIKGEDMDLTKKETFYRLINEEKFEENDFFNNYCLFRWLIKRDAEEVVMFLNEKYNLKKHLGVLVDYEFTDQTVKIIKYINKLNIRDRTYYPELIRHIYNYAMDQNDVDVVMQLAETAGLKSTGSVHDVIACFHHFSGQVQVGFTTREIYVSFFISILRPGSTAALLVETVTEMGFEEIDKVIVFIFIWQSNNKISQAFLEYMFIDMKWVFETSIMKAFKENNIKLFKYLFETVKLTPDDFDIYILKAQKFDCHEAINYLTSLLPVKRKCYWFNNSVHKNIFLSERHICYKGNVTETYTEMENFLVEGTL